MPQPKLETPMTLPIAVDGSAVGPYADPGLEEKLSVLRAARVQWESEAASLRAPELTGDTSYIPFEFTDFGVTGLASHETTFGHEVLTGYGYCRAIDDRQNKGEALTEDDKIVRVYFAQSLLAARSFLSDKNPAQQAHAAEKLFGAEPLPDSLAGELGGKDAADLERLHFLNAATPGGNPRVSDETLIKLLAWHNARMIDRQQKYEQEKFGPMRARLIARLQWAEHDGWLDPGMLTASRMQLVQHTPVLLDDDLHFRPHNKVPGSLAYTTHMGKSPSHILIKNADALSPQQSEYLFTHEMVHVLTGNSPDDAPSTKRESTTYHEGYGLQRLFSSEDEKKLATAINEGTTDFMALALLSGGIQASNLMRDMLIPGFVKQRPCYENAVYVLRKLPIDPKLYFKALFEGYAGTDADTVHADAQMGRSDQAGELPERGPRATQLQEELSDIFGDKWRAELLDIFVQYEKRGVDSLKAVVRLHKTVKQFKTKT